MRLEEYIKESWRPARTGPPDGWQYEDYVEDKDGWYYHPKCWMKAKKNPDDIVNAGKSHSGSHSCRICKKNIK